MTPPPLPPEDLVAAGLSAALLVGYQAFVRRRSRRDPTYTVQGTNALVRARWVTRVMEQNKDILAVQTLRNSTMAATFLASTAVVFVMGILNLVARSDALPAAMVGKLVLLLLDLFVAFFGFAMSVRLYNHVGYMVGMPGPVDEAALAPAQVARHLNRAAGYYSVGMRAFYLLVPLVFWFFGPLALGVATVGLVVFLWFNDRAPRGELGGGEG